MFIGRERELDNMRYEWHGYECVVIYGRRRVGKTTLIRQAKERKNVRLLTFAEMMQNDK